jgi:hypothetical protein
MSTETNVWNGGFLELALVYKNQFFKCDTEEFMLSIGRAKSICSCFNVIYGILLQQGRLQPIEQLSEKEKLELFEEAKRISDNKDKTHIVQVCRALHTLGTLIQE